MPPPNGGLSTGAGEAATARSLSRLHDRRRDRTKKAGDLDDGEGVGGPGGRVRREAVTDVARLSLSVLAGLGGSSAAQLPEA